MSQLAARRKQKHLIRRVPSLDLTGMTVSHKKFGEGIIERQDNGIMTIKFKGKTADFRYPDAFEKFLEIEDKTVEELIAAECLAAAQAKAESARLSELRYSQGKKLPSMAKPAAAASPAPEKKEPVEAGKPQEQAEVAASVAAAATVELDTLDVEIASQALQDEPAPELQQQAAPAPKKAKPASSSKKRNIAFKCAFCDGGRSDTEFGYNGICTDLVLKHNVGRLKRPTCIVEGSFCAKYTSGEITRSELDSKTEEQAVFCPECSMLTTWRAGAGFEKVTKPKLIRKVRTNSLCALTTRSVEREKEDERYIFAAFLIGEYSEGDDVNESYVMANPEFKITMTPEESGKIRFWDYYQNEHNPTEAKWGSGLFRYLSDEDSEKMLRDILDVKKGTPDEAQAKKMLDFFSADLAAGN
jgi:hypothetical protein